MKNERRKMQQTCVHEKTENTLTEPTAVCGRWKEYIEELYDKENTIIGQYEPDDTRIEYSAQDYSKKTGLKS